MKDKRRPGSGEMRAEYNFDYSTGVRGKYYRRLIREESSVVQLDPDVASAFRTSAAVNQSLRNLLKLSDDTQRLTSPRIPRQPKTRKGKRPSR